MSSSISSVAGIAGIPVRQTMIMNATSSLSAVGEDPRSLVVEL